MKKIVIIITICVVLSIIGQCTALSYIDNVLLKESNEFDITKVEVPEKVMNTDIEMPEEADNIQVSYSGKYIIYSIQNKLTLINTKTSEVNEILQDTEILDYKWVPNNNTIFIVYKDSENVKVKTYNAINGVQQEVCEVCSFSEDMKIKSYISISAEYISVNNGLKNTIYRIDIDKDCKKIDHTVQSLGSAAVFWNKDVFIYQDSAKQKFYRYTNGKSKEVLVNNPSRLVILCTVNNIVYMGELAEDNKKISKIIYGEDTTDPSSWKTENLDKPRDASDIYVNKNNKIFINNGEENKIKNLTDGGEIEYKGTFVSVNDRAICSLDNKKISLKSVSK